MKLAGQGPKNDPFSFQKELLCGLSEVARDMWHIWPQMSQFSYVPPDNNLLFPGSMDQ